MRVTKLELSHFRGARHVELTLDSKLNVFVGVNGAGKTSVLDAIALMLSWAVARIQSAKSKGRELHENDIHNSKWYAHMTLTGVFHGLEGEQELSWRLVKTRKGGNPKERPADAPLQSSFRSLDAWADRMRDDIGASNAALNLPLFVYYPVNRAVQSVSLKVPALQRFDLLEAYDDALSGSANFRTFFEWYRNREDLENEQRAEAESFQPDRQLEAVRRAIRAFLPELSSIAVKRNPLRMEVATNRGKQRIDQLSDGEKGLFAMIGDLARRLAIANPTLSDPLGGNGIILIDEIELHLHPAWQRMIVPKLTRTFPNCQFIITTHSPQVLGEVDANQIRILSSRPYPGLAYQAGESLPHDIFSWTPRQAKGLDSCEILEELMGARSRDDAVTKKLGVIFGHIDDNEFDTAKTLLGELRDEVRGDIPETIRAESLITMLESPGEYPE